MNGGSTPARGLPTQARPGQPKSGGASDGMTLPPLAKRQLPLLFGVAGTLLLSMAFSNLLRSVVFPLVWSPPFYVNPFVVFTLVVYVGLGLIVLSGPGDQGWPFYLGLVGLWVFVVTFEFSIVQWFEIQLGIKRTGSQVSPLVFTACAAAVAGAILLHMNQLRRRLFSDLRARGLDPEELVVLDDEAGRDARAIVAQLVGLAFVASLILWVWDLIVGSTSLGLDVLGILLGLLIMSVLLVYSYTVLKKGPVGPS